MKQKPELEQFVWEDEMIKQTQFIVRANRAMMSLLKEFYDIDSLYNVTYSGKWWKEKANEKLNVLYWKQVSQGISRQIGMYHKMPIMVSLNWEWINEKLVCFYESESMVTHYDMLEKWIQERFSHLNFYDRHCGAGDFNKCVEYVKGKK